MWLSRTAHSQAAASGLSKCRIVQRASSGSIASLPGGLEEESRFRFRFRFDGSWFLGSAFSVGGGPPVSAGPRLCGPELLPGCPYRKSNAPYLRSVASSIQRPEEVLKVNEDPLGGPVVEEAKQIRDHPAQGECLVSVFESCQFPENFSSRHGFPEAPFYLLAANLLDP